MSDPDSLIGVTCCDCGHVTSFHCRYDEKRYIFVCELCGNAFYTDLGFNILDDDSESDYRADIALSVNDALDKLGVSNIDPQVLDMRTFRALSKCGAIMATTKPFALVLLGSNLHVFYNYLYNSHNLDSDESHFVYSVDSTVDSTIVHTVEVAFADLISEHKEATAIRIIDLGDAPSTDLDVANPTNKIYDGNYDRDLFEENKSFSAEQLDRFIHHIPSSLSAFDLPWNSSADYIERPLPFIADLAAGFATLKNSILVDMFPEQMQVQSPQWYIIIENIKTGKTCRAYFSIVRLAHLYYNLMSCDYENHEAYTQYTLRTLKYPGCRENIFKYQRVKFSGRHCT